MGSVRKQIVISKKFTIGCKFGHLTISLVILQLFLVYLFDHTINSNSVILSRSNELASQNGWFSWFGESHLNSIVVLLPCDPTGISCNLRGVKRKVKFFQICHEEIYPGWLFNFNFQCWIFIIHVPLSLWKTRQSLGS